MTYDIKYGRHIDRKRMEKIPKEDRQRIHFMIEEKLRAQPEIFGKPLHNPLYRFWSLRVGTYRVIYKIEGSTVHIELIGHRSTIYPDAEKWLA